MNGKNGEIGGFIYNKMVKCPRNGIKLMESGISLMNMVKWKQVGFH